MATLILTSGATVGTGARGAGSAGSVPASSSSDSHLPAIFFASSQSQTLVDLRPNFPSRIPDAKIGQSQRFHPF